VRWHVGKLSPFNAAFYVKVNGIGIRCANGNFGFHAAGGVKIIANNPIANHKVPSLYWLGQPIRERPHREDEHGRRVLRAMGPMDIGVISPSGRRKRSAQKSRIANGDLLLTDKRSVWARLMKETLEGLRELCGGTFSETQYLAASRVSTLEAELIYLEDKFAQARAADVEAYGRIHKEPTLMISMPKLKKKSVRRTEVQTLCPNQHIDRDGIVRGPNGGARANAGRPPGTHTPIKRFREAAQQHTERAVAVIAEIMNDHEVPPIVRLAAARELLDRGHGKAREHVMLETVDAMNVAYRTVEEIEQSLIAKGFPLDKLNAPRLIEHEPSK
jgi:hypothetical protein